MTFILEPGQIERDDMVSNVKLRSPLPDHVNMAFLRTAKKTNLFEISTPLTGSVPG